MGVDPGVSMPASYQYSWELAYVCALEERDCRKRQKRIETANRIIRERLARLEAAPAANRAERNAIATALLFLELRPPSKRRKLIA